ncbi:MAG: Uncharacterised protein [Halieaceae bacterium]|nr:MAG: lysophospholipid acyltransferase family protein [Halieaceae bacterium]CAI8333005.1 MAG: Uncharacterised protein [Halieaceae bacterium]|tara:strand:+ start:1558 stop:3291 length:1734 start_codon:yes stop_codon:yes gene_type:complete
MFNTHDIIRTRYPEFANRHRHTASALGKFLGMLLYKQRFEQFEQDHPHLTGFDFVEAVLRYFDFHIRLRESERARIPSTGKAVIVANHPIGSLDGIALLHLVRQVRPDVKVVANDILMAIQPLSEVLLPVDNMGGRTARQSLMEIKQHLSSEGALIIFPAGEVSRLGAKGVKDGPWSAGFVKIAAAASAPILPIFVKGRNSLFFYSLSFLAKPLSTLWLVREMFKQNHRTIDARIGCPIPAEVYKANHFSAQQLAHLFRKHVYRLGRGAQPLFKSVETVAPAESKLLVRRELQACTALGSTQDGKTIYLTTMTDSPCVMREIARLRELTFRLIGEGTGLPRDMDRYDRTYLQLVLWDDIEHEIAGAYRLGRAADLIRESGPEALYTHSLFSYGPGMQRFLDHGLELGRSFVQPKYQNKYALDYLWSGLGAYLRQHPEIRYLFGPASMSRLYGSEGIARMANFFGTHHNALDLDISARNPFTIEADASNRFAAEFTGLDYDQDYETLKDALAERGLPVPVLFKHYANVAERDGVAFTAFNIDPDFGDCVDAFVLVDLQRLKPRKRKRYLEREMIDGSD